MARGLWVWCLVVISFVREQGSLRLARFGLRFDTV